MTFTLKNTVYALDHFPCMKSFSPSLWVTEKAEGFQGSLSLFGTHFSCSLSTYFLSNDIDLRLGLPTERRTKWDLWSLEMWAPASAQWWAGEDPFVRTPHCSAQQSSCTPNKGVTASSLSAPKDTPDKLVRWTPFPFLSPSIPPLSSLTSSLSYQS